MNYNYLGKTNIKVSEFALGCWPFAGGSVWGTQDKSDSISTVHAALDNGINFFDTAEGYNDDYHSESILGEALVNRRNRSVIATKISPPNLLPQKIEEACNNSLKRLSTDYIDLYQIHWPNHDINMEDSINELNKLVDKGKIRSLGVCNFGVDDLNEILNLGVFSTDQLPYNLLWRPIEEEILPECKKNNIGIICYSPLAQGLLTGRYRNADEVPDGISRSRLFNKNRPLSNHDDEGCENEVFKCINKIQEIAKTLGENSAKISLSWVRQQSNITSLLVGARNTKELEMNLSAFEYDLSTELIKELSDLTNNVKLYLGKNPDMWKSDNRMR
ncbi:MAG: aldo/keto reductase [SAR202 cluster bacterium]|jgi:aryl-alcohol dehydrogenase-like predicted oxidoreductase|nr:MAG: aldo/keto reductase [SAR202 cluster bacterium]MQG12728.1 aldo/keto reductase [SAR202 cluster bacterium]|tara:strand:- start:1161 stop:2153 length:993 start_codon:yes stop_codon:yes gene_type:complete